MRTWRDWLHRSAALLIVPALALGCSVPPPVLPAGPGKAGEAVALRSLPLPPTAPSTAPGSCTHTTGCIDPGDHGIAEGPSYLWDARHVLLPIRFAGAPVAPAPRSEYSGDQVIIVKTDGTLFANGDGWKCLTCGMSDEFGANRQPGTGGDGEILVDHPQAFRDGRRVLMGTNVFDCGANSIIDEACSPENARIYPIAAHRPDATMRELRLHPDDAHVGFSEPVIENGVFIDQFAVFAELTFDDAARRYELSRTRYLLGSDSRRYASVFEVDPADPARLLFREPAAMIGEFRGFTSDGRSALGVGTLDSWNFDIFTTDLRTAESRRLTSGPAYTDPADMSPDDRSLVFMDGTVNDRMNFAGGLPGVPPLIDMVNIGSVQFLYNNGHRRFFQPFLVRTDQDHAKVQQLNACAEPTPGSRSLCDPLWNGRADPAWSPDGTSIVYWQAMVAPPACGPGQSTAPDCPVSKEPGGRSTRLIIADLTDRKPQPISAPGTFTDDIPWSVLVNPGDPLPRRSHVAGGTYTLSGAASGETTVVITENPQKTAIVRIEVAYRGYSHDGINTIDGTESATAAPYVWHSDLRLSGKQHGSRKTAGTVGFVITPPARVGHRADIGGELVTTLDGEDHRSPATGQ